MIDSILEFNRQFVADRAYEPYITDKFPAKKLAVLTCMDTRLTELLPKALGLRNGDAKIIKNAGGLVLSETDSAIRSLLVGIYELGVQEVMVVHHSTCGACHMSYEEFKPHMLERGVSEETLEAWEANGVADWLEGFHDTEASVRKTVAAVVSHPLVPAGVTVRGFIIDSVTGELTEVDCPDAERIARIKEMEFRLDRLSQNPENKEDYEYLSNYLDSEQWRQDFEADEAGLLPEGLKRGVLSEDGLYNLLESIA